MELDNSTLDGLIKSSRRHDMDCFSLYSYIRVMSYPPDDTNSGIFSNASGNRVVFRAVTIFTGASLFKPCLASPIKNPIRSDVTERVKIFTKSEDTHSDTIRSAP